MPLIRGAQIKDGTITGADIQDLSITSDDIDNTNPIQPDKIDISWLTPVSSSANLPTSADDGDVIVTLDTGSIYVRSSGSWSEAGSAIYDSSDFDTDFATKTTDDLTEGSTNKYFFSHDNTQHSESYITSSGVTYENLSANSDIGTGSDQVAQGDHTHDDRYFTETETDSRYLQVDGSNSMTGNLVAGTINLNSVNPSDTATLFGTDSSGDSTFHIRIGNGTGDKIQFESWNGSAATGLLEITQTDINILGNLNVTGTTTTIESTTLDVSDSDITLNSGQATPTLNASIIADRGSSTDSKILWNETSDKWQVDNGTGSANDIVTSQYIKSGSGTFNNTAGSATTITHNYGSTSYYVNITPTTATGGYLGEWYVTNILANSFDVVKTGSATGITFHWHLIAI